MLTVAQMFLLNTCVALRFFSWMWSSAASATVVFSAGLPPAACAPQHTAGVMLQAGRTLLCVAVRWHLIPSWILEKLLERRQNLQADRSFPDQHQGKCWECSTWSWRALEDLSTAQRWLRYSRWRFPLTGFCGGEQTAGVVPVGWIMNPGSVMLAWRLLLEQLDLCTAPHTVLLRPCCML